MAKYISKICSRCGGSRRQALADSNTTPVSGQTVLAASCSHCPHIVELDGELVERQVVVVGAKRLLHLGGNVLHAEENVAAKRRKPHR
jgi:hypothetical protein